MKFNWLRGAAIGASLIVALKIVPHFLGDSIQSDIVQILIIIVGAFGADFIGKRCS